MKENKLVSEVIRYIEGHLDEELTLDRIAGQLHYNKYHISRQFTKAAGRSICQYIRECRLNRAAEQLWDTDDSIAGIAQDAGYGSQQAFTRAFGLVYHCTPDAYRRRCRRVSGQIKSFMAMCYYGRRAVL